MKYLRCLIILFLLATLSSCYMNKTPSTTKNTTNETAISDTTSLTKQIRTAHINHQIDYISEFDPIVTTKDLCSSDHRYKNMILEEDGAYYLLRICEECNIEIKNEITIENDLIIFDKDNLTITYVKNPLTYEANLSESNLINPVIVPPLFLANGVYKNTAEILNYYENFTEDFKITKEYDNYIMETNYSIVTNYESIEKARADTLETFSDNFFENYYLVVTDSIYITTLGSKIDIFQVYYKDNTFYIFIQNYEYKAGFAPEEKHNNTRFGLVIPKSNFVLNNETKIVIIK